MRKLLAVLNPTNKYLNALYCGGERVVDGNSGLENIGITWKGKRAVLQLEVTEFVLTIANDRCPEAYRYPEITSAFGNRVRIRELAPVCDLLQMSATACDGCPKRPSQQESKVVSIK